MSALVKVDFRGDTILAQEQADGPPLIVLKPIVERLGLDWSAQLQRIKRDEILAEGVVILTTPSPGGPQDAVALPLNLLPGFLFGISEGSIPDPEIRKLVLAYKRECHDVLYRHFLGDADPGIEWDWEAIAQKLSLVREIRLTLGRKAAAQLLYDLDLPGVAPPESAEPPRTGALQGIDFVKQFIAERTAEAPGGRVQARELSKAYAAWAAETKAPTLTERALAICFERLGLGKSRGNIHYYLGIRIRHLSEFEASLGD